MRGDPLPVSLSPIGQSLGQEVTLEIYSPMLEMICVSVVIPGGCCVESVMLRSRECGGERSGAGERGDCRGQPATHHKHTRNGRKGEELCRTAAREGSTKRQSG